MYMRPIRAGEVHRLPSTCTTKTLFAARSLRSASAHRWRRAGQGTGHADWRCGVVTSRQAGAIHRSRTGRCVIVRAGAGAVAGTCRMVFTVPARPTPRATAASRAAPRAVLCFSPKVNIQLRRCSGSRLVTHPPARCGGRRDVNNGLAASRPRAGARRGGAVQA